MYIYKTTNIENGKIYIGLSEKSSDSTEKYLGSGDNMKKAISKYGSASFTKEILEDNIIDKKSLAESEIKWIAFYKSDDRKIGYNLSPGGDLNPGHMKKQIYQYSTKGELLHIYPNIDEAKRSIDSKNSDLYKKKIRGVKPIKGFWWSIVEVGAEIIINRNEAYLLEKSKNSKAGSNKRYNNPEELEKQREHMRGIQKLVKPFTRTPEQRQKISENTKNRKWFTCPVTGKWKQTYECPDGFIKGRLKINTDDDTE